MISFESHGLPTTQVFSSRTANATAILSALSKSVHLTFPLLEGSVAFSSGEPASVDSVRTQLNTARAAEGALHTFAYPIQAGCTISGDAAADLDPPKPGPLLSFAAIHGASIAAQRIMIRYMLCSTGTIILVPTCRRRKGAGLFGGSGGESQN